MEYLLHLLDLGLITAMFLYFNKKLEPVVPPDIKPKLVVEEKPTIDTPIVIKKEKAVLITYYPHPNLDNHIVAVYGRTNPNTGELYPTNITDPDCWIRTVGIETPNCENIEEYLSNHSASFI